MRFAVSLACVLSACFLIPSLSTAQPRAYQPRGVRSYLVNYSAIRGDRFLAEFAARRFSLIDEAGSADIPLMHAVDPALPVLRYKDIVALHRSMPEFPALDRDEYAFMHASEPSGLQLLLRGDTAAIAWLPDRRDLPIAGYRLSWHLDSLDGGHPLDGALLPSTTTTIRLPKSAVFVSVATELEDGSRLNYGFPVRKDDAWTDILIRPDSITESRTDKRVDVAMAFTAIGGAPDSVFIIGDWNRDNQLDARSERTRCSGSDDRWSYTRSIDIEGLRTSCGYEFRLEVWKDGAAWMLPRRGSWHSNVNNRLINNTYGFYVMNVGSSTWRKSYVEQILLAFSQRGYSGLFEDDCWDRVANYGVDAWPPEPYDTYAWRRNLHEMLDSIRIGIAPRPAYFNGLASEASDSLLLHTEGGMTEGFAYTHWSGLLRGSSWRNQCNRGLSAQHRFGKSWLALGGAPFDDPAGRLYALASYLLVTDSLSMFANATNYQEFAHFPEFDIPLGRPLEYAGLDVDDLLHADGGGSYYRREFERGTVVVNAGSQPVVYPDVRGRPVAELRGGITTAGGRLGTAPAPDTLLPGSACIYLDLLPAEQLASPVIDSIRVTPPAIPSDGSTPCEIAVLAHDTAPARWRSDSTRSLYIVADAGTLGGPRELILIPASPADAAVPTWYRGSFSIPVGAPPDSASLPVTVYSTTGLLAVGYAQARIRNADSANLIVNYSFEIDNNDDGIPDLWRSYVKGFDYDTTGVNAVTGSRSVHVRNDSLTEFRGASMHIDVNQTAPEPLELAGWSKCVDVSGDMNNDYALYADIRYTDGTPLYGRTARFSTGTHDWEYSSTIIEPEKPIASISLYALFRHHTGEAWFDQLSLRPWSAPNAVASSPDMPFTIELFPNPVHRLLHLVLNSTRQNSFVLKLYDRLGRCVRRYPEHAAGAGRQRFSLDVDGLHGGVYFLTVQSTKGLITRAVYIR